LTVWIDDQAAIVGVMTSVLVVRRPHNIEYSYIFVPLSRTLKLRRIVSSLETPKLFPLHQQYFIHNSFHMSCRWSLKGPRGFSRASWVSLQLLAGWSANFPILTEWRLLKLKALFLPDFKHVSVVLYSHGNFEWFTHSIDAVDHLWIPSPRLSLVAGRRKFWTRRRSLPTQRRLTHSSIWMPLLYISRHDWLGDKLWWWLIRYWWCMRPLAQVVGHCCLSIAEELATARFKNDWRADRPLMTCLKKLS